MNKIDNQYYRRTYKWTLENLTFSNYDSNYYTATISCFCFLDKKEYFMNGYTDCEDC